MPDKKVLPRPRPRNDSPATVAVYGAGRVGCAIAASWLRASSRVVLADIDRARVDRLNAKKDLFPDEPLVDETIHSALRDGSCSVTADTASAARSAGIVIIAVPVGLKDGSADLGHVRSAARDVARGLEKGALVCLETTVPVGTTRNVLGKELEDVSGMKAGRDFCLAYSPERISEGRAVRDIEDSYPKVVAGLDGQSLARIADAYSRVAKKGVVRMSSIEAAEAEKIFEGIYRDVNIALANELSDYSEAAGIDYWEVMEAANSQPFCHLHRPGPGVGGACIPVYPRFVLQQGGRLPLISAARSAGDGRPAAVARKAVRLSGASKGSKVAVLGLAFRADVADDRLSSTYGLAHALTRSGFKVTVHDPHVKGRGGPDFEFTDSVDEALDGAKLVVLATDHSMYRQMGLEGIRARAGAAAYVFDARGVFRGVGRFFALGAGAPKPA